MMHEEQNAFSNARILRIEGTSPYIGEIIRLADENSSSLGFLPRDAFLNRAAERSIFVSVDEHDRVLGYLLFGTNRRESLVYITHLCVRQQFRGNGVAKALFNELVKATRNKFRGVRVRCRRDYEATIVWPRLGFYVQGEMPGRSKLGSTLTVWWFDFGHPTLFSFAYEQQGLDKLQVVIDWTFDKSKQAQTQGVEHLHVNNRTIEPNSG